MLHSHHSMIGCAGNAIALLSVALCLPLAANADTGRPLLSFQASPDATPFKSAATNTNGSGIELSYQVEPITQFSGSARITLRFAKVTDAAGASFRIDPDAELIVASAVPTHPLSANQTTTFVIDVRQRGEATGYLNVFTTQHGTTSVASIPVQLGKLPSGLPKSAGLKQSANGEKISPIPVK